MALSRLWVYDVFTANKGLSDPISPGNGLGCMIYPSCDSGIEAMLSGVLPSTTHPLERLQKRD